MSSLFDSEVYLRSKHTPWAEVNLSQLIADVIYNDTEVTSILQGEGVNLHVSYRPDVASRMWWELEWTSADGQRRSVSAQRFDLLKWRAATIELRVREEMKRREKEADSGSS